MVQISRGARALGAGIAAMALALGATPAVGKQVYWTIDNLHRIGGHAVTVVGQPRIVAAPTGKALAFSGKDSVLIEGRELVGAGHFTVEVLFKPEGGPLEQRFVHIAETDPMTGLDAPPAGQVDHNSRLMFEIRVRNDRWVLDTFVMSRSGNKPLIFWDKTYPLGRWYVVAQTYDGHIYRSYVDGVLQGEAEVPFTPHGPGRVRIGSRMNGVDYFHGRIAAIRFTDRALHPEDMLRAPRAQP